QQDAGLPVTGLVDVATSDALDAAVQAKTGEAAAKQATQAAAVQTALKLAGYWTGPIDGMWTPQLTAALKDFQTALGVKPTGAVGGFRWKQLHRGGVPTRVDAARRGRHREPGRVGGATQPEQDGPERHPHERVLSIVHRVHGRGGCARRRRRATAADGVMGRV